MPTRAAPTIAAEEIAPSEPLLEQGDRLSREEFERRYEKMPHVRKVELILPGLPRREFLWRFGGGLGGIALAHLLGRHNLFARASPSALDTRPSSLPDLNGGLHH